MEWVEITGRTVQEATDQALDELGVDEADAEVQVLEEPRAGLFGRTRGTARVKARVVPRQQRPKQERKDRRRGGRSGGASRGGSGGGSGAAGKGAAAPTADAGSSRAPETKAARPKASDPSETSGGARRRRSGGGSDGDRRGASPRPDGGAAAPSPGRRDPGQGDSVDTITMTLDEHTDCVRDFVAGLVTAFGVEGTIEVVEIDDDTREVRVVGDDLGLLIGPRGLTLQAVHELARTVVYRKAPDGQDGRVRIDIGGYRERRREALIGFAGKVAESVLASGTASALEPMSPPDRKIVHDTINEISGVHTTSEGEEPRRRVVVHPGD